MLTLFLQCFNLAILKNTLPQDSLTSDNFCILVGGRDKQADIN